MACTVVAVQHGLQVIAYGWLVLHSQVCIDGHAGECLLQLNSVLPQMRTALLFIQADLQGSGTWHGLPTSD